MNVLVIGGGGREHTIVWKLAQSPKVKKLYAIPGGPGMMGLAECVPMDVTDLEGLAQWAETHAIDLTVVGPEAPSSMSLKLMGSRPLGLRPRRQRLKDPRSFPRN